MSAIEKKSVVRRMFFACGVDIGTQNLAISFVGVEHQCVISYKGTLSEVRRYREGCETQVIQFGRVSKRVSVTEMCEAYVAILDAIPEFNDTVSAVIEMQLAFNRSEMSRLDGIAYGFLSGRFPEMKISLNSATIRRKFISDRLTPEEMEMVVPRGYPQTKHQSLVFVCSKMPTFFKYIMENEDKVDDICDSVVYAYIGLEFHRGRTNSSRGGRA